MRRGVGVGYVSKKKKEEACMASMGDTLEALKLVNMQDRLVLFKQKLQEFAEKHGAKIKSDPSFRYHFNTMCTRIGVDPLASGKGFWCKTLGYGDFYYELSVQVAEICLLTRKLNGGLMPLAEITERIRKKRPPGQRSQVVADDVAIAVSK
eukprot:Sspe_Gene.114017::Locus_98958_Transcript_1_1_Confidence_1.000_Length_495::g.114017::m.114017/K12188/SNF8, EAP30; ESCRT-II complex subunit VPS22